MAEPSSTQHQIKTTLEYPEGVIDKRRAVDRRDTRNDAAVNKYGTAVAAGTTTTIVVRIEDAEGYRDAQRLAQQLDLYDSAYVIKGTGTNKAVTGIAYNATLDQATITFTPAALAATAAGDFFVRAGAFPDERSYHGIDRLDDRLNDFSAYQGAAGTQRLLDMTTNDKQYQLRIFDDFPSGVVF